MSLGPALDHASLVRPCQGEQQSGDCTIVRRLDEGFFVAIIDVLGHGDEAAQVANSIRTYLERYASEDVCGLMQRLHEYLRGTRGAAVGLCTVQPATGHVVYTAIGNTVLRRFGKSDTRLVSREGIVGQNMRTPKAQSLTLEPGDLLLLYTDGITDHFSLQDYPAISRHAVKDVVRVVLERFGRDYDDASCIALRYGS